MRFLSEAVNAHIKHIQGDLLSQFCVVNVSLAPALGSPSQPAFLGHLAVGQHIHLLGRATHTKSGQFYRILQQKRTNKETELNFVGIGLLYMELHINIPYIHTNGD